MPDTLRPAVIDSKGDTSHDRLMSPNDTPVTTAAEHAAEAAHYLDAAKAYRFALQDAYSERPQDRARIGDLHQAIGFGLKVAHVHAVLAQALTSAARVVEIDDRTCLACVGGHTCEEADGPC